MGELSLDLNTATSPSSPSTCFTNPLQSVQVFIKEAARISNVPERISRAEAYIRNLEDEMRKIDAFKRELPLCMLLLNDAIRALKFEKMQWKAAHEVVTSRALKAKQNDLRDKKNWMSSVQLWSDNANSKTDGKDKAVVVGEGSKGGDRSAKTNDNGGGPFASFKGFPAFLAKREEKDRTVEEEPSLSLVTPGIRRPRAELPACLMNPKAFGDGLGLSSPSTETAHSSLQAPSQSQGSRKQRRTWSPDLHRRFINALQELGGSQVATPKQIREMMKVDGLTNDEVKSHLQKYRLHTRRYSARANANADVNAVANAAVPDSQKLVLFGGLWVPREQCGNSKTSTSESESPQGPLQLMGTSGGTSTTGGDSMEDDEEDEKSESYTWKGQFYKPGEDDA